MSLNRDFERILDVVERVDPSFGTVDPGAIDHCVHALKQHASRGRKDPFLLAAMALLALPGNGHTRLIPNDAISVVPFRFVTIGASVYVTGASGNSTDLSISTLVSVNGNRVADIERASSRYLAGTPQRKRVIGPLLLAWPAALAQMGFAAEGRPIEYEFADASGRMKTVTQTPADLVPASSLYPKNEHGKREPIWRFTSYAEFLNFSDTGHAISLPSFFDPNGDAFVPAILNVATKIRSRPNRPLLIDLRGNTGGDFLKTLPLIDAIEESCQTTGCVALVDKFTFSAAIVFVAILKYRLGSKLRLIGEDMGDGWTFFAEGGLVDLPVSGAAIRFSTALHDWETGSTDHTTPPEIAERIVPVGNLKIDQNWTTTPFDDTPPAEVYRRVLEDLF